MKGVDVLVRAPSRGAVDELGNPARSFGDPETVGDVLVMAGATSDSQESNRPDGVGVAYTLTFPASYAGSLRGCEVKVPGDDSWYGIAGDPRPTPAGQLGRPLRWNRTAEAVRSDG